MQGRGCRLGWGGVHRGQSRSIPLGSGSGICPNTGLEQSGRRPPASSQAWLRCPQLSATLYMGSFCTDDTHTSGFSLSQGWFVCLVEARCIGNRKLGYEAKAQLCAH